MEINFASSDSLRLGGRWVREGESVTKWGNRSNISHLLIGCKTIYIWWGDVAWFVELLRLQWFVKLSHGWKGPNVKEKSDQSGPRLHPWHRYLTRFGLNFPKLPLIIRPPPLVCCKLTEQGLDWLTSGFFWPKIIWRRRPTRNWQLPPSSPALQSSGGEFFRKWSRLRWSTRRQSVLPCDVSIQCLCQILRSWSVPHVSVSIPAISVRSSGHPP